MMKVTTEFNVVVNLLELSGEGEAEPSPKGSSDGFGEGIVNLHNE